MLTNNTGLNREYFVELLENLAICTCNLNQLTEKGEMPYLKLLKFTIMSKDITLDNVPVTELITFVHEGTKYSYRQLIPNSFLFPQRDLIIDITDSVVYTVAAVAYNTEDNTLVKVVVLDADSKAKVLNLNQIRILHDIRSFNPTLN